MYSLSNGARALVMALLSSAFFSLGSLAATRSSMRQANRTLRFAIEHGQVLLQLGVPFGGAGLGSLPGVVLFAAIAAHLVLSGADVLLKDFIKFDPLLHGHLFPEGRRIAPERSTSFGCVVSSRSVSVLTGPSALTISSVWVGSRW